MKIALIIPPMWAVESPPLGIAYISSALKEDGHHVKTIDFNIECFNKLQHQNLWLGEHVHCWSDKEHFSSQVLPLISPLCRSLITQLEGFDAIGFSLFSSNLHVAEYITKEIRRIYPQIKTFAGGPIDLSEIEELIPSCFDQFIQGEGDKAVLNIFSSTDSIIRSQSLCNLDDISFPDFTQLPPDLYTQKRIPIMMSRGCVGKCHFCSERGFWQTFRTRSAQSVFQEMSLHARQLKNNKFDFYDSLINGNHTIFKDLINLLIESDQKLYWHAHMRFSPSLTEDLLQKTFQAGCTFLVFGLESGSQAVLNIMNKGVKIEVASQNIIHAAKAGIQVGINLMPGFPGETKEHHQETMAFLEKHAPYFTVVNIGIGIWLNEGTDLSKKPGIFGIATTDDGDIILDSDSSWISNDGTNNSKIRAQRREEIRQLMEKHRISHTP